MVLLSVTDLIKTYRQPDGDEQTVLDVPSFAMGEGEQVALEGSSGSGKTTLLNVIAGILKPDEGEVVILDRDIAAMTESQRDAFRADHLGYVFQTFNLLQGYTAVQNVLLGMTFGRGPDPTFASELLATLGLESRLHYKPAQLSIGQQQRVAVARALANHPQLVLADEPTGNLDSESGEEALETMRTACRERGAALLLVSHDHGVLGQFERRLSLASINRAAQPVESA